MKRIGLLTGGADVILIPEIPYDINKVAEIALRAAKQAMNVISNKDNVLPLKKGTKALFVYQVNPVHERTNTQKLNPATPWLEMLK